MIGASEGAAKLGVDRDVASAWPMPEAEQGWIEGVAVLVSKRHLSPLSRTIKNNVVLVPTRDDHNGVVVRLFFEEVGAVSAAFPVALPIAVLDRFGGGRVYVFAEPVEIQNPQLEQLEAMCSSVRDSIASEELQEQNRFVGVGMMGARRIVLDLCVFEV